MLWLYLALGATILWGIGNIFKKFVLEKHIKNPIFYLLFNGVFLIPVYAVIIILFVPIEISIFSLIAVLNGFIFYISVYFQTKAFRIEEVSRIIPLGYTEVIFTLILSMIFLKEFFTFDKYIGIFLIFVGAFLISYEKGVVLRKGAFLVLTSSFLFGIYMVLSKYILGFMNFMGVYFWTVMIGFTIIQIPLLIKYKKTFFKKIKSLNKNIFLLMIILGLINTLAMMFLYLPALSLGPASLVSAIDASRSFFVLLFVVILSLFFPNILKENLDKNTIILKIISSILIISGVFLIA